MNSNAGVDSFVAPPSAGPAVIVVCGAVASTVQFRVAGAGSALPAPSIARTENVCGPSPSAASVIGQAQVANAPPSIEHSNVPPGSLEVNSKRGVGAFAVAPRTDRR